MDVYARAVRRLAQRYDCCPDRLTTEHLETHFAKLVESHSWSTVKVDRNGLQFFNKHILKRDWSWVKIIKAPRIQSLPDILTLAEVEQLNPPPYTCHSRTHESRLFTGSVNGDNRPLSDCRLPTALSGFDAQMAHLRPY